MVRSIVYARDHPSQTIANRRSRGELRRLARGIYSTDLTTDAEVLVQKSLHEIAGRSFPDAVITDRSALTAGAVDGFLWLSHDARERDLELPGVVIAARRGPGALPGDTPLPGGLYLASRGRALVDNSRPSRASHRRPRRTLDDAELADWINRLCQIDGDTKLQRYREQAEALADDLGATPEQIKRVATLVGAALGTQKADTASKSLNARQLGVPFDPQRVERFDQLVAALRAAAPQSRPGLNDRPDEYAVQAFWEAYFSNYIEGTTFTVDEARQILFDGVELEGRQADSHDIIGTYQIVADVAEMSEKPTDGQIFIDMLRSRHARLMAGRPGVAPGDFKENANQAGQTLFVDPALVHGTLLEGFDRLEQLDTAWERATYIGFVVGEVHPFVDGNGRMARVTMNSELVRGNQSKLIVPTGFRSEYLAGLRRLSRQDDPSVWIKSMRFLHDYTSQIDWGSDETAEGELRDTNAFNETEEGPRLRLVRAIDPKLILPPEAFDDWASTNVVEPYMRYGRQVSGYPKPQR